MTLTARTDRRLVRAGVHSTRHVLVEVTAPTRPVADERTPLNVAFILDRSGSMGGQKIALARQAVERAISALDERDRFSVVVYDDAIDVVVESTTASGEAKRNALRRVAHVDARGSTNLADGWLRGAEQVALHQSDDAINRCLLLTDGLANVGETDPETLARHAAELRARGVVTSTFGVGADFDERLLGALADAGGGHFYFIERAVQIPDFITSELGELLAVVAREATLDVQLAPGFRLEPLSTLATEQREGGCRLALGDLVSGQEVEVVLSLEFPRGELGLTVSVFFTLDDREGALRGEGGCSVTWTYADHAANNAQPRDRDVDRAVARLYAARAEDEALRLNAAGRFDDARRALAGVAERIRGYADRDEELNELAARLGADQAAYAAPMAPLEMKARYFASANTAHSRDASGRARRR
jgi:Ca-activated chloride channel family protein